VDVFVAGGAGFIGSQFVRSLLADEYPDLAGASVTVFDKLTYAGNEANLAPVAGSDRYRFVRGDICVAADLDAALPGHDLVVNFAAESHVDRSIVATPTDFVLTNVLGAQQVFDACLRHGVPRVVHVSTDEVYGSIDEGSWREDHALLPNSPYSATKASADLIARAYATTHGLDVSITRGANTYGPYQFPEKIIPLFVTNLLDGRPVPLYDDGRHVRDWISVADHCRAIALVAARGGRGEVYNVGGDRELSNRELTGLLLAATSRDWNFVDHVADPRRGGHDRRYSLDCGKIADLGFVAGRPFEEGLHATVEWYRSNRAWWEPLKAKPGR
jgi:dTDP-glucose 4,6-dehydratase